MNLKLDIVDADDFASVNVDYLLIEEIAIEQEQAFSAVGGGPFGGICGGVNIGVDGRDGGEGKNAVAGLGLDDERSDAITVLLRGESDFANAAGWRARRVIDRGAKQLGEGQRVHPG